MSINPSKSDNNNAPTINSSQQQHKQKHRIGTGIKVTERIDGKRKTFCGTATSFEPSTGQVSIV